VHNMSGIDDVSDDLPKYPVPTYLGNDETGARLPDRGEYWRFDQRHSAGKDPANHAAVVKSIRQSMSHAPWQWPSRPVYFLTDPHADADAFTASLAATACIRVSGRTNTRLELTDAGRSGLFVIGGDCLDKGPSGLHLLRTIKKLYTTGARVKLLAGNHDVRLMMGLRAMTLRRAPTTEHFFIRMGPKIVPLLREVHEEFLAGKPNALKGIPGKRECRRILYPSSAWFEEFPRAAAWLMPEKAIKRELVRLRKKIDDFADACDTIGLSLRDVYATAQKCRQLFLEPKGEFAWFFARMQLTYREGSFLFIHAGLDDRICSLIEDRGIGHLNRQFRNQIKHDLFEFYYGPLANAMRTKYRDVDMPLSRHGVKRAYRHGIHAVVHGHRNRLHGQRIMLHRGMIHIESDVTLDRNTRRKEGLNGFGAGVTIVLPEGRVIAVSTDYPYAKIFEPEHHLKIRT